MENHNLDLNKYLKTFKKGTFIYLEGDPAAQLYLIKSGEVELRRSFNAGELIIGKCGPGEFFGLVPAIEKWVYLDMAEAIRDSEIFVLEPAVLEQLVINNPAIGFRIVNHLSSQLRELDIKLDKLSRE